MFPWLTYWSPVFRFPYSGAVNQNIQPQTDWFVGNVTPGAGVADIEREVVLRKASYGRQLAALMEAVLAVANELSEKDGAAEPAAVGKLRGLQTEIESIKRQVRSEHAVGAREALDRLAESDPESLADLLAQYSQRERS